MHSPAVLGQTLPMTPDFNSAMQQSWWYSAGIFSRRGESSESFFSTGILQMISSAKRSPNFWLLGGIMNEMTRRMEPLSSDKCLFPFVSSECFLSVMFSTFSISLSSLDGSFSFCSSDTFSFSFAPSEFLLLLLSSTLSILLSGMEGFPSFSLGESLLPFDLSILLDILDGSLLPSSCSISPSTSNFSLASSGFLLLFWSSTISIVLSVLEGSSSLFCADESLLSFIWSESLMLLLSSTRSVLHSGTSFCSIFPSTTTSNFILFFDSEPKIPSLSSVVVGVGGGFAGGPKSITLETERHFLLVPCPDLPVTSTESSTADGMTKRFHFLFLGR
mmetsp:Transcript_28290/g.68117  ORF Transcript_28290/g.68117 Transcript_28290/m.68117 type:complete len:332 (+) Transcript_28290:1758-2753(+)